MSSQPPRILVVDDDPINRMILRVGLEDEAFTLIEAGDGLQALAILESDPEGFDAVLLDRMMPRLDGPGTLKRMRQNASLPLMPVIIQTAASMQEELADLVRLGAFFYLPKPFEKPLLVSVLRRAVADGARHRRLQSLAERAPPVQDVGFQVRDLDEAEALAARLAQCFPRPGLAVVGLYELLANAVRHGCRGYGDRADVTLARRDGVVEVRIADPGPGFDWRPYCRLACRLDGADGGRGIVAAVVLSFDEVGYNETGNLVVARCRTS